LHAEYDVGDGCCCGRCSSFDYEYDYGYGYGVGVGSGYSVGVGYEYVAAMRSTHINGHVRMELQIPR